MLHLASQDVTANLTFFMRMNIYYADKYSDHFLFVISSITWIVHSSVKTNKKYCWSHNNQLKAMLNSFLNNMSSVHFSPVQQLVQHRNPKTTYNMEKTNVMEWL